MATNVLALLRPSLHYLGTVPFTITRMDLTLDGIRLEEEQHIMLAN